MATHPSILAWVIPRTEEPGGLQSMGSQRVGHNWARPSALPWAKDSRVSFWLLSCTACSVHLETCLAAPSEQASLLFWLLLPSAFWMTPIADKPVSLLLHPSRSQHSSQINHSETFDTVTPLQKKKKKNPLPSLSTQNRSHEVLKMPHSLPLSPSFSAPQQQQSPQIHSNTLGKVPLQVLNAFCLAITLF